MAHTNTADSSTADLDICTYTGRLATFGVPSDVIDGDNDNNHNGINQFRQWPETAAVDPAKLARAGFYFNQNIETDGNDDDDDTVECFACHKRLAQWKFNDSALRRHRDASPQCPFISSITEQQHSPAICEAKSAPCFLSNGGGCTTDGGTSSRINTTLNGTTSTTTTTTHSSITAGRDSSASETDDAVRLYLQQSNSKGLRRPTPVEPVSDAVSAVNNAEKSHADATPSVTVTVTADSGPVVSLANQLTPAANSSGSDFTPLATESVRRLSMPSFVADAASVRGVDDSPDPFDDDGATTPVFTSSSPAVSASDIQQYPEYFSYEARLRSFSTQPNQSWPISHIIPADLADAGFFYTGESDKVQCAFCGGVQSRWQPGDQPWLEHIKYFPLCPLVRTRLRQQVRQRHLSSQRSNNNSNVLPHASTVQEDDVVVQPQLATISYRRNSEDGLNTISDLSADDNETTTAAGGYDVTGINDDSMLANEPPSSVYLIRHTHRAGSPPSSDFSDEELGILSNTPKRADLATIDARIATFGPESPTGAVWPQHEVAQQPSELAEAGLYYIGKQDKTKCFFCDGALHDWQPGDIAWNEHARWYPHCSFVLSVKGRAFVNEMLSGHCPTSHSPPATATPATLLRVVSAVFPPPMMPLAAAGGAADDVILSFDHRLRVPRRFVEEARLMGFTDVRIRRAIELLSREQLATNVEAEENAKTTLPTFGPLLQHILRDEQNIREGGVNVLTNRSVKGVNRFISDPTGRESPLSSDSTFKAESSTSSVDDDVKIIPAQQQQSSTQGKASGLPITTCKICMDHEVGVAFLPCSHLVSCAYCAPALKFCPVCRTPIKKIFKTYLS